MTYTFSPLILVILCGVFTVNAYFESNYIQVKADQKILQYMRSARSGRLNGENAVICFDHYIPILNEISETYQRNYELCIFTANQAIEELIEVGDKIRLNITTISNETCSRVSNCQQSDDNLSFFDCHSNLGESSVRNLYTTSEDASEAAADYRECYRVIQETLKRNQNETQRVFVTDTANAYSALDDCLDNGLKPTTTESSNNTEITDSTTVATETTQQSSTEQPTTEQPTTEQPTTQQPTTEKPTTEQPTTEQPTTEQPTTEQPTTEQPTTEQTTIQEPDNDNTATDEFHSSQKQSDKKDSDEEYTLRQKLYDWINKFKRPSS